jgi:hypothetical protein
MKLVGSSSSSSASIQSSSDGSSHDRGFAQQSLVVGERYGGIRARELVQFPVGDLVGLQVSLCERTDTRAHRVDRCIVALREHDRVRRCNQFAYALHDGVVDLVAMEPAARLVRFELARSD